MAFRGISLKTQKTNSSGCRKRYKLVNPFHFSLQNDIVSFDILPPTSATSKFVSQFFRRTKIDNVPVFNSRIFQGATKMVLRKTWFSAQRNLANIYDDFHVIRAQ